MNTNLQTFVFEQYQFDTQTKILELVYSFDEETFFTESITFDFNIIDYDQSALEKAFFLTWILCGISYFKATLPPTIKIKGHYLDENQASFFTKIYTQGLGEFFFENNINPHGAINFPISNNAQSANPNKLSLSGNLLPIGGGKDSLVSAQILQQNNIEFTPWVVGGSVIQSQCCETIGKNPIYIQRTLDPQLFELNTNGALNGHVPISAILAGLSICTAILTGKQNIILSNEASANHGNTTWQGLEINHQYSKSLEFEQDLKNYVDTYISPDIHYFSLLRPWSELQIAKFFGSHCWRKYQSIFSSCNRNFHIAKKRSHKTWCGNCPKCAFVFLILAPFVGKNELIMIFGKNLFLDPSLKDTFDQLLGISGHKPFECVGETIECQQALFASLDKFPELKLYTDKIAEPSPPDWKQFQSHCLEDKFEAIMKSQTHEI